MRQVMGTVHLPVGETAARRVMGTVHKPVGRLLRGGSKRWLCRGLRHRPRFVPRRRITEPSPIPVADG
ncbi:MAG: hypothetical protein IPL41_04740 [Micropruina sp.]|nr:hypothetical protein [Micropruina sp.]